MSMAERAYGVGVVGVGVWGCHSLEQTLVRTGRTRVIAVSTEDRWGAYNYAGSPVERGRDYAREHQAEFQPDWHEVVQRPDVHIVSAMVCPRHKAEVILAALEAGKHVVTDKPLAFTPAEAEAICAAEARSRGRGFLLAGYHLRPHLKRLICELRKGRFGEIKAVALRLCFMGGVFPGFQPTPRWRSEVPSGELTTIGSHALVTLFRLLDEPIAAVYAVLRNAFYDSYRAAGAEDWAELNLRFASGAIADVTVGRLPYQVPDEDISVTVTGTAGYARLAAGRLDLWPDHELIETHVDGAAVLQETFTEVLAALDHGGPMPTSFHDGLRLQHVLAAALRSAETNSVVRLAP
jgi:predicted dehydrogenase